MRMDECKKVGAEFDINEFEFSIKQQRDCVPMTRQFMGVDDERVWENTKYTWVHRYTRTICQFLEHFDIIIVKMYRTRDCEGPRAHCICGWVRKREILSFPVPALFLIVTAMSEREKESATIESDVLLGIMERVAYTLMKGLHLWISHKMHVYSSHNQIYI